MDWKYISSSKETGMNLVQLLSTPTLACLYSARHQNYVQLMSLRIMKSQYNNIIGRDHAISSQNRC